MAEVQIKTVSVKHDAIMDYLLGNPTEPLSGVAKHFNMTQAWLSVIIHSDAFQAQLDEKKRGVFEATVIPLRERLVGIANLSVGLLGEALEQTSVHSAEGKTFIADTTDSILKNLGFSPKALPTGPGIGVQQNNFIIQTDKKTLAAARETMRVVKTIEQEAIEHTEDTTSKEV